MVDEFLKLAGAARIYDLGQPYFVGMPHFPTHPPFLFSLNKKHGDLVLANEGSSAAETLTLGGHVGTHIDALCHFSCAGKMFGGVRPSQTYGGGVEQLSVDTIAPMLRRGVLLDAAAHQKADTLPVDFTVTPDHLDRIAHAQGVEIRPGDIVLLRTGWATFWNDQKQYITGGSGAQAAGPGPELPGAKWLSSRKVFAVGADTIAFERVPSRNMDVHIHLLVESGIHIIEALNLEDLARDHVYEFAFVAVPMKIRGGTGSPLRPLALAAQPRP
ncbi:MAG: cyclase family protein [Bryobacteraceae bacterium]